MDSKHEIPLLVSDLMDHTVIGETGVVDDVVDLAKSPDEDKEI